MTRALGFVIAVLLCAITSEASLHYIDAYNLPPNNSYVLGQIVGLCNFAIGFGAGRLTRLW